MGPLGNRTAELTCPQFRRFVSNVCRAGMTLLPWDLRPSHNSTTSTITPANRMAIAATGNGLRKHRLLDGRRNISVLVQLKNRGRGHGETAGCARKLFCGGTSKAPPSAFFRAFPRVSVGAVQLLFWCPRWRRTSLRGSMNVARIGRGRIAVPSRPGAKTGDHQLRRTHG